jgi:hypothetical protein
MKTIIYIITIFVALATGFFAGRMNINSSPDIVVKRGDPVHEDIHVPEPKVSVPDNPVLPVKIVYIHDTVPAYQVVDTTAIITDYIAKREYNLPVFNNELGKLSINADVQYNKLFDLSYDFTPVQKEIKIKEQTVWIPFVGISYNTLNQIGLTGGIFYHNIGIEAGYSIGNNVQYMGIGMKYKF